MAPSFAPQEIGRDGNQSTSPPKSDPPFLHILVSSCKLPEGIFCLGTGNLNPLPSQQLGMKTFRKGSRGNAKAATSNAWAPRAQLVAAPAPKYLQFEDSYLLWQQGRSQVYLMG